MRVWDRQRVLGLVWLVGSVLTALTLVVPYGVDPDPAQRLAVVVLAFGTGTAVLLGPPLGDRVIHGLLVLGTAVVAWCTSQGLYDAESEFFLLPVAYAFATFPPRAAMPHLVVASVASGGVAAFGAHSAEPTVSWAMTIGVGAVVAFTLSALSREREAGLRGRRIAEELQRTLLPERLPDPLGVTLSACYLPAEHDADVGGDLYDAIELHDGRILLVVGDVAGKGLGAAATVGALRSALRAYALDDPSPASILVRLDRLQAHAPDANRMVTMLLALLDLATGTVRWASAGHLPPLVSRAGGGTLPLAGEPGPPLGAHPAEHHDHVALLHGGDGLVLLTDGLVERRGEPLDEGLARVAAAVGTGGTAQELVRRAIASTAGPPQDDVAVLAAELVALGDVLEVDVPGRPDALAGLRAILRRWLNGRAPAEDTEDLVTAVNELAANAIRHGGATEERPFTVRAQLRDDDMLMIAVADHGRWRGRTPDPDRGRGLSLARGLVGELAVRTGPRGTEVTIVHRSAVAVYEGLTMAPPP